MNTLACSGDPARSEPVDSFECRQCGQCCRSYGYVYLTTAERVRLAVHFGITESEFRKQYCLKRHGEFHLKNPEKDCCFLEGNRCSVYELRPEQCRTWPFWPENMSGGRLKKNFSCPGYASGNPPP